MDFWGILISLIGIALTVLFQYRNEKSNGDVEKRLRKIEENQDKILRKLKKKKKK